MLRNNIPALTLGILTLLLGYGFKMFNDSYSIDTEALIAVPNYLYHSWIELERFGVIAIKHVFGLYWYNNVLASLLTGLMLFITAFTWGYLFYELSDRRQYVVAAIAIPYIASPVLAEMIGFTLTGPEVAFAIFLVPVSIMLLIKGVQRHHWAWYLLSFVVLTIAFTIYLATVTVFVAAIAMIFYVRYRKDKYFSIKTAWGFLLQAIAIFATSYIAYRLLNKIVMSLYHVTTNPYITEQSRWGKDSLLTIFKAIAHHAIDLYTGSGIYYSVILSIGFVVFSVICILDTIRQQGFARKIHVLLVGICILASPMMMSVILGQTANYRTEMTYTLLASFVILMCANSLDAVSAVPTVYTKFAVIQKNIVAIVLAITFVFGWTQALIINRIFYTEHINHQQDRELALSIHNEISKVTNNSADNATVVFIGIPNIPCNLDCYPENDLALVGRSIFRTTVSAAQGTFVKTNFMNIQGAHYLQARPNQIEEAQHHSKSMPSWPAQGSITQYDNMIIVKLSNDFVD